MEKDDRSLEGWAKLILGNRYGNLKERRKAMFNKTFYIAGVKSHELHKILDRLEEGDTLSLVPEPTNKFDPNAVRIECHTDNGVTMCGYVPKKFSSEIMAQVVIGKLLKCEIVQLDKEAKPWEQCKVAIEEVAE